MSKLVENLDYKSLIIGGFITIFIGKFTDVFDTTVTDSQLNTIARKIVDEKDYRKVLIDEIKNDNSFKGSKGDDGEPNIEEIAKKLAKEPGEIYQLLNRSSHFVPTNKDRKYGYSRLCALTSFTITDTNAKDPKCHLTVNKDFLWSIEVNEASCGVSCLGNGHRDSGI